MNKIPLSEPVINNKELKYVTLAIKSNELTVGQFIEKFEKDLALFHNVENVVTVSSGTAALHLSLIASNIKQNDEVFVPAITFIAPINTIRYIGAYPIFIDCDNFLNICPKTLREFINKNCTFKNGSLINKVTKRKIKAIIPVHIFGNPVNMSEILNIANEFNLTIIEDATESLGSYYIKNKNLKGLKTGTIGRFGCLSFNGNKIITTGGGGAVICKAKEDANYIRYLANQAKDDSLKYIHNEIGFNYRLSNIQAAIGCAQLEKLKKYIKIKRKNFTLYQNLLKDINEVSLINEPPYSKSNYWFYSLVINNKNINKDKLIKILKEKYNIETRPIWYLNYLQKPYINEQKSEMKNAPHFFERVINLPCSVNLTESNIKFICDAIKNEIKNIQKYC